MISKAVFMFNQSPTMLTILYNIFQWRIMLEYEILVVVMKKQTTTKAIILS